MFIFITISKKHIDYYLIRLRKRSLCLAFLCFAGSFSIALDVPTKSISEFRSNAKSIEKFSLHHVYYPALGQLDSLPLTRKNMVAIPFEYKQSALYQLFTFKVIDSVINILLKGDSVKLSIAGFAHVDEGSDSICYYLSLNRALVIKDYVLGRGIDSSRILSLVGYGNLRSRNRKPEKHIMEYNCRAEVTIVYPVPPPKPAILDKDDDGIADSKDACPEEYGPLELNGCPNRDAIIVPFEPLQSSLYAIAYKVLDSVIVILRRYPSITITIEGYAYKKEGVKEVCDQLARERADIVKKYLLTRMILPARIDSVKNSGNLRPLNAGKNPEEIERNSRAEIYFNRH
jgi:outer membrane protein OmpA-like peptidoglycan-associated protein